MSQSAPARKRPPNATAYIETEVDISPEDLEQQGWIYVGKREQGLNAIGATVYRENSDAVEIVRAWHDREHTAAWVFCDHDPCRSLR